MSSSFSSGYGVTAPMVTRSLDDMRSFRVEGGDGEFDLICRSLGLSGPEDFNIPESDWKAMKVRSSSDLFLRTTVHRDSDDLVDAVPVSVEVLREKEVVRSDSGSAWDDVEVKVKPWRIRTEVSGSGGGRLIGARPSRLAPPPGIMSRKIDDGSSTWDLFKGFAPEGDEYADQVVREVCDGASSSSSDADELAEEAVVQMEPCSAASSYDCDRSSAITRSTSPVRFRQIIAGWIKGQLLGRGSYGSVYEAMSV